MDDNESLESLGTRSFNFESFKKRLVLIRCAQRISFIELSKRFLAHFV